MYRFLQAKSLQLNRNKIKEEKKKLIEKLNNDKQREMD